MGQKQDSVILSRMGQKFKSCLSRQVVVLSSRNNDFQVCSIFLLLHINKLILQLLHLLRSRWARLRVSISIKKKKKKDNIWSQSLGKVDKLLLIPFDHLFLSENFTAKIKFRKSSISNTHTFASRYHIRRNFRWEIYVPHSLNLHYMLFFWGEMPEYCTGCRIKFEAVMANLKIKKKVTKDEKLVKCVTIVAKQHNYPFNLTILFYPKTEISFLLLRIFSVNFLGHTPCSRKLLLFKMSVK